MQKVPIVVPLVTNGMTSDPRDRGTGLVRRVTGFDTVSDRRRSIPYRDSEDGASGMTSQKYQNFCIALRTGTTYSMYALGVVTGTGRAQVDYKDLTTGASNDLDDNGWATTANNSAAAGAANFNLFVYYKKRARIFLAHSGTTIRSYDPSGAAAFGDEDHALAYTNMAQGLVHSQDDIFYVFYDNKVAKNDNNSWTDAALTLPSEFYITSACEYGEFIAIMVAPLSGVGKSRVFLWNRSSTLTTISGNIDWGEGTGKVIEEIEGLLVGITLTNDTTRHKYRVTFRYYAGTAGAIPFEEFTSESSGGPLASLGLAKQKINNRLFFLMRFYLNGTQLDGVWSISRRRDGGFAIAHERTPNNDTAINANGVLRSFFFTGDYLFIAYVNSSNTEVLSKTNDSSSFTASAIIETVVNPRLPEQYRGQKLKLHSVGAMYDALPTAGQVVVKARVDSTGSYLTIFTETTDSQVCTEPVAQASDGTYISDGKEFEFQIISTGGAVPTALIYVIEVVETNASP